MTVYAYVFYIIFYILFYIIFYITFYFIIFCIIFYFILYYILFYYIIFYITFQHIQHDGTVSFKNAFTNATVSSLTSKTLTVTMLVNFDLTAIFNAQFVNRLVIYLRTRFLKRYCSVALIICSTKLVPKKSYATTATWFYALLIHYLEKLYTLRRSLTIYRFRTLRPVLLLSYSFTF